ncbi:MAG: GvpL/GvpF family gas vesicle protein [Acetobacteraceae bacterium]|nr:GvpL/GvpF family gas vesicle protein [Acetobacteraceae bacterium]
MSELACLYLALAARAAGRKVDRALLQALLGVLGAPCRGEFLEAVALLVESPAAESSAVMAAARPSPAAAPSEPPAAAAPPDPSTSTRTDPATALPPLAPGGPEGPEGVAGAPRAGALQGRYLYGVVRLDGAAGDLQAQGPDQGGDGPDGAPDDGESCQAPQEPTVGVTGLNGEPVYLVQEGELGALVHACTPVPYQSDDPGRATAWLEAHYAVLQAAMARWGGVIPASFDTVLRGEEPDADAVVRRWLVERRAHLCQIWQRIAGKAEYGVEIAWDAAAAEQEARAANPEIARLEGELASLSPGLAYLQRRRLDQALNETVGAAAEAHFRRLLEAIRPWCSEVRVEAAARIGQGHHLVLKAACLGGPAEAERLGEVLEETARRPGFAVRFTGPWPPFSFVE